MDRKPDWREDRTVGDADGRGGLAAHPNPQDEPGKIVFIVRMGAGNVPQKLPPLIEAVTARVATSCG